jgi:hypothetical protein
MTEAQRTRHEKPVSLIYIVGTNYSGTTLLTTILGCHPDVESLGQVFEISDYLENSRKCMCGVEVPQCPFWSQVLPKTSFWDGSARSLVNMETDSRFHGKLTGRFGLVLPIKPRDQEKYRSFQNELMSAAAQVSKKRYLVDSSKTHHRLKWLVTSGVGLEVNLFVLHMTRNGLGVVQSYKKRGNSFPRGAAAWVWRNRRVEKVITDHVGDRSLFLRYEDLCQDPETCVRQICSHVGLEFEYAMMDFRSKVQHQVGGNPMRFGTSKEIRLDEKWREHTSEWEKQLFSMIAGTLQRKYGY